MFAGKGIVFQIGPVLRRSDIITHIERVDLAKACEGREDAELEGLNVPFISKADL